MADWETGPSVGWEEPAKPKGLVDGSDEWEADDTPAATNGNTDPPKQNVEDFADVDPRSFGWVEREKMDYDTALATTKELEGRSDVPQWSSEAKKYEWKDEYGDVGPEDKDLEDELFKDTYRPVVGEALGIIGTIEADVKSPVRLVQIDTMDAAGFHPIILENLRRAGYDHTTPIQAWTIPYAMAGHDVLGISQTGSGKTVAFLAPVLSKLMGKARKYCKPKPNPEAYNQKENGISSEPLVVILVPTRELALQVYAEARRLCYRSMLRPSCVYGGGSKAVQINDLMRGCDILIGTPGRLSDLVTTNPDALSLRRVKYTIFDEADELMDVDWEQQMAPILTGPTAHYTDSRQYLMFSATFNREAREAAAKYLEKNYTKIVIGRLGSTHMNIHQVIIWTEDSMKRAAVVDLLKALPVARTIIFCANVERANVLDDFLYRLGFPSNVLHSKLMQREREMAMEKFKRGSSPILVTTHLGGRGIDVENVQHVLNYDLPSTQHGGVNAYCHQIGRTGRIGNVGQATSFYNDRNEDIGPDLAKLLVECNHELPEFLQQYAPAPGEAIIWEDNEDAPAASTIPLNEASVGDPGILASSWGEVSAEPRATEGDAW